LKVGWQAALADHPALLGLTFVPAGPK